MELDSYANDVSDKSLKHDQNLDPELVSNIVGSFKTNGGKNKPIKSTVNVEADYLSMSSTQMKNHLSTIKKLVEENNAMKEQIQNKIQDANHFKFLANEYEQVMKEETAKSGQYKTIMLQTQQTFK